ERRRQLVGKAKRRVVVGLGLTGEAHDVDTCRMQSNDGQRATQERTRPPIELDALDVRAQVRSLERNVDEHEPPREPTADRTDLDVVGDEPRYDLPRGMKPALGSDEPRTQRGDRGERDERADRRPLSGELHRSDPTLK